MNFTREPIIETIVTPREGYRLLVRSTKHPSDEPFHVDAVEVVSFGPALFYRNLEKPKPFLLPVADYQVVEVKEVRAPLKTAPIERTIKIGGGKEAAPKKEIVEEEEIEKEVLEAVPNPVLEQKRERRRNRRRHREEKRQQQMTSHDTPKEPLPLPVFTHLIPPPPNLIADSIQKYKEQQQAQEAPKLPEEPSGEPSGDANIISRSALEPPSFEA